MNKYRIENTKSMQKGNKEIHSFIIRKGRYKKRDAIIIITSQY